MNGELTLDDLRARWQATGASSFEREEALWAYFRRLADGERPLTEPDLDALLQTSVRGVGNVAGLLAERDTLPQPMLATLRRLLQGRNEPDALFAVRHLAAREALYAIQSNRGDRLSHLDALVQKGTSWAAIESVAHLSADELRALDQLSEDRRLFTRGQREDLRAACRRRLAELSRHKVPSS